MQICLRDPEETPGDIFASQKCNPGPVGATLAQKSRISNAVTLNYKLFKNTKTSCCSCEAAYCGKYLLWD